MVLYSQCNYTFITAEVPESISPSNPGRRGTNTMTLNRSPFSAALMIRLTSVSATLFNTFESALFEIKN